MFDYSWFDAIEYQQEKGIFFIVGGLFNYFKEERVTEVCQKMANQFPCGELIFDVPSKFGMKYLNKRYKKMGVEGAENYFGVGNPEPLISKWSDKIHLIDWFTLFERTQRNPRWSRKTRFMMWACDVFRLGKFIHFKFQ